MSHEVTGVTTLEIEFELRGSFQPGYPATGPSYASGGEPGQGDMIEDGEVIGLFIERAKRTLFGTFAYENEVSGKPGAFTKKVYERVDLLAGVSDAARKEVLLALNETLRHEIEDQLLDDADDG